MLGATLKVMEADALRMRVKRPFIFTNLKSGEGVDQIASFAIEKGGIRGRRKEWAEMRMSKGTDMSNRNISTCPNQQSA